MVWLAATAASGQTLDALSTLNGRWFSEGAHCAKGSTELRVAADRRTMASDGTYEGKAYRSTYLILAVEARRVLTFIQGEARLTATGDPVIWWAMILGPDRFAWRRYDWPRDSMTPARVRRC
ncbi:MAG: hypothetical protein KF889_29220 [Alphaproteobacteria bacterium]|nr:hypothetical protein [Alphaproteobacteria bacterium]MCW5742475.1 hypothetical protein [Alphaproteobacteria bacterium]